MEYFSIPETYHVNISLDQRLGMFSGYHQAVNDVFWGFCTL